MLSLSRNCRKNIFNKSQWRSILNSRNIDIRSLSDTTKTTSLSSLDDEKLLEMMADGTLKSYRLEEELNDTIRAANLRKKYVLSSFKEDEGENKHIG